MKLIKATHKKSGTGIFLWDNGNPTGHYVLGKPNSFLTTEMLKEYEVVPVPQEEVQNVIDQTISMHREDALIARVELQELEKLREDTFINEFDWADLIISTTRYYLGRSTISTYYYAKTLAENWDRLPKNVRYVVRRDVEDALERDDRDREHSKTSLSLGHDVDREGWELVRSAWK